MSIAVVLADVPAQQLAWQVPSTGPTTREYLSMLPFVDYDHDGYRDFLRSVYLGVPASYGTLEVASGLDGSTLWARNGQYTSSIACHAGDMDGDGEPDLALCEAGPFNVRYIRMYSPSRNLVLWQLQGTFTSDFGRAMLGDLDVDGDGLHDFVTITTSTAESDVYVYDNRGTLLYTVPCKAKDRLALSLAKLGDMDNDGADDFLVGCLDSTARGVVLLISGRSGDILRQSFGLLPGDHTAELVTNTGDMDGDGVDDYVAFPYWSAQRYMVTIWSGATGTVIRAFPEFSWSVIAGEDFDQDGVPDLAMGADWAVAPPQVYGATHVYSGRDGTELWRVENFLPTPGSQYSNGSSGWMRSSANLGVQPGDPYPVFAWMDTQWFDVSIGGIGRIRAYGTARAGQGPLTGTACTSSGTLPRIGMRNLGHSQAGTGTRITIARSHPNALASLNLALTALPNPVDLSPLGFANCHIYVDPTASYLRVTGTSGIDRGYAAVDLPYPPTSSALGTQAVAQWLVFDPATADYAATQAHALRLQ